MQFKEFLNLAHVTRSCASVFGIAAAVVAGVFAFGDEQVNLRALPGSKIVPGLNRPLQSNRQQLFGPLAAVKRE